MRISVPLTFQAVVIPKGAQKWRAMSFGEWVDVEVQEATNLEAPIAVEWRNEGYGHKHYNEVADIVQLRFFNGQFYQKQVDGSSGDEAFHTSVEDLIGKTQSGAYYANPLIAQYGNERDFVLSPHKYPTFKAENFRDSESEKRAKSLEALQLRAAETLIIDGHVWKLTAEPVLKVSLLADINCRFSVEIISSEKIESEKRIFRLDRLDDAIAYGKVITNSDAYHIDHDPQIHMSETLSHQDDLIVVTDVLKDYIRETKKSVLDETRQFIDAWLDFREAVWNIPNGDPNETIDAAVQAAKAMMKIDHSGINSSKELVAATRRWDSKPIQLNDIKL